jgi:DNA polymerase III epsilon subunit family exonuclease
MSVQLGYSMFYDVLFPEDLDSPREVREAQELRLRRLKRFVPEPSLVIRDAPIVVFDLETTGLDPTADRIIEVGAIKLDKMRPVAEFSSLVSTSIELTDDIIRLTGITPAMLEGQPTIDEVLPRFLEFIDGCILVAHNAEFDLSMIKAASSRAGIDLDWPCFCTLKMARELLPDLENKKLDTLASYYGLSFEARHRAIGDIKVTVGVLGGLLAEEASAFQKWSQLKPFMVDVS